MKAKHFLMIAILSLIKVTPAQPANDPSLKRVQSSEKAAMTYLIEVVEPKYPADVKTSGKVVLKIVIDKEGHVSQATLLSGDPLLVGARSMPSSNGSFILTTFLTTVWPRWRRPQRSNSMPTRLNVVTPKPMPPPRLRIASGVAEGLILRRPNPDHPLKARTKHIQGNVILNVSVDTQGNVIGAKVISGDPLLAEAAANSVKQWKYKPYTLNGEPVEFETSVKVQFHL